MHEIPHYVRNDSQFAFYLWGYVAAVPPHTPIIAKIIENPVISSGARNHLIFVGQY